MTQIMIVEDDINIREDLKLLLEAVTYHVVAVEQFEDVTSRIREVMPDLVLLDMQLPHQNGREICKQVRQYTSVPIIFVTSDDNVTSEIGGMLSGGDDYITKPYHPTLLLARIAAVLKRTGNSNSGEEYTDTHKGVTLNISTYEINYAGGHTELSKNECRLLHYLFEHKGQVVPRLDLIEYLWDNEVFIDDNALSVTVTRIRSKLEALGVTDFIETKRGVGYRI